LNLIRKLKNKNSPQSSFNKNQSAQTPDGKPGRELASWAQGFFRLDFLVLFYQEKSSSLAAMSGQNIYLK